MTLNLRQTVQLSEAMRDAALAERIADDAIHGRYSGPRRGGTDPRRDADWDENYCVTCRSSPCRCADLEQEAIDEEAFG